MHFKTIATLGLVFILAGITPLAASDEMEEIIVTGGVAVTQGGAQDIDSFRGGVSRGQIPHPNTFTAEGLLSQHDILLNVDGPCEQTLCLSAETMAADLIAKPDAELLVGIGFGSNLDADKWRRDPVNLVAVVDKSGSMGGDPIELVKRSLANVVGQLRKGDQLTIVLFGSTAHVHLSPLLIGKRGKKAALDSIGAIQSQGSTAMENGLRIGYDIAFETAANFPGSTRLMLFTDERPNVGKTDAESFMGMAKSASQRGIGLTTIGVSTIFGAELATTISSVRGGNLFFLRDNADADRLFSEEFDFMVSELAHDLKLIISPDPAWRISGVYGIPGELMKWHGEGVVEVTIPTVFLAARAGGIFFTLAKSLENRDLPPAPTSASMGLAKVSLSYLPPGKTERGFDTILVNGPAEHLSHGMKLGHLLIDEFAALHKATSDHYANDQESAYQTLRTLATKFRASALEGLEAEKELIFALEGTLAHLSGHSSEGTAISKSVRLWGVWEIYRKSGIVNLERRDKVQFMPDGIFEMYRRENGVDVFEDDEDYEANEDQIYLDMSELLFDYTFSGRNLILRHSADGVTLRLKPSELKEAPEQ